MKAKYSVFIPSEAKNVAIAAHHYLSYGPLATLQATVHHGTPFDTLTVFAEDTPEIDSHMKQLGVFVGEVANTQTITVTKEAGKGISTWEMGNPHYQAPVVQDPALMQPGLTLPPSQLPQASLDQAHRMAPSSMPFGDLG